MGDNVEKIRAPFSPEQVEQLNRYQVSGLFHPFTCYNGHPAVAREDGWFCPLDIAYHQDWAWEMMADQAFLDAYWMALL